MPMPVAANALPTIGQMPTLGNPQQQVQEAPNSGMLQAQLMQQQRQREMADALMKQGYVPNSGALGALAQIASAYKGKKMGKASDEKIADYTARLLQAQTQEEATKAQNLIDAEIAKDDRKAKTDRETKLYEHNLKESEMTNDQKDATFFAAHPQLMNVDMARGRSRASSTNITMPGQNYNKPFDEALAKSDVGMMDSARTEAMNAQRAQQSADALEGVLKKMPAGKPQQFYGQMSQYFGAKAGADYQTQKALVEDQVNSILNAAKGPQTDQDAERARAQIPNMGTDPRARAVIFDYIKKKNKARVNEFQSMDSYGREHGNLQGYQLPLAQDSGGGGGSGEAPNPASSRPRAVNPKTGKAVEWDGEQWVKAR